MATALLTGSDHGSPFRDPGHTDDESVGIGLAIRVAKRIFAHRIASLDLGIHFQITQCPHLPRSFVAPKRVGVRAACALPPRACPTRERLGKHN